MGTPNSAVSRSTVVAGMSLNTGLDAKTAQTGWDADSDEVDIPVGTEFLHVNTDEGVFLIVDSSLDPPGDDGCAYGAGTHLLPCRGCTKLHYKKSGGSNAEITISAFGNDI